MRPHTLLILALTVLALTLTGCGEEKPAPPAKAATKTVAKPPAAQVPPPAADSSQPPPAEVKFVYQVEGRRDPFMPLLAQKGKAAIGREFENPLEAYDLVQYQLKGVIVGLGEPKAIVFAPDGKSYILKKGLRIGKSNGVIREITPEKVLVEEQYQDITGKTHSNLQEIKVPRREGV